MKPGETTRVRRRTLATSCGERTSFREAPPPGTGDTNDARLRETEELQQRWGMRDDETLGCDIEHAGRHATEALDTGVGIPRKLGYSTRREHSRA